MRFTERGFSVANKGKVYIIGAGPGDPGLFTIKGLRCLKEADVIIYDFLVNAEIIHQAKDSARLIYAGKKGGDHTLPQDEINRLLLEEAKQGNVVARVKGGDPFIFGRGGEEAEILAQSGIPFEIVPGVTSAAAVPAYAGIPLTHRGHTSTVAFVTGHEDATKEESDIDWKCLAGIGTVVFLMGVRNLGRITANLMHAWQTCGYTRRPHPLGDDGKSGDPDRHHQRHCRESRGKTFFSSGYFSGRRRRGSAERAQLVRDAAALRQRHRDHKTRGAVGRIRKPSPCAGCTGDKFPDNQDRPACEL